MNIFFQKSCLAALLLFICSMELFGQKKVAFTTTEIVDIKITDFQKQQLLPDFEENSLETVQGLMYYSFLTYDENLVSIYFYHDDRNSGIKKTPNAVTQDTTVKMITLIHMIEYRLSNGEHYATLTATVERRGVDISSCRSLKKENGRWYFLKKKEEPIKDIGYFVSMIKTEPLIQLFSEKKTDEHPFITEVRAEVTNHNNEIMLTKLIYLVVYGWTFQDKKAYKDFFL